MYNISKNGIQKLILNVGTVTKPPMGDLLGIALLPGPDTRVGAGTEILNYIIFLF